MCRTRNLEKMFGHALQFDTNESPKLQGLPTYPWCFGNDANVIEIRPSNATIALIRETQYLALQKPLVKSRDRLAW